MLSGKKNAIMSLSEDSDQRESSGLSLAVYDEREVQSEVKQYSRKTQETVDNLRIIDDAFFRLIAEKQDVCQEILRILLDMPNLKVISVTAQNVVKSIHREVILDAFCLMEDGSYGNIEMQKSDTKNDIPRTRFYASTITTQYTPKGTDFSNIPKVTVLYITEYDALENNQTITHVTRCMKTKDGYVPLNDGEDIIFANTCIKEDSDKSELLQLMLNKDSFYNEKFPAISNAVRFFKDTEGGRKEVCKLIEEYAQESRKDERINTILEFVKEGLIDVAGAAVKLNMTEEDVVKLMNQNS